MISRRVVRGWLFKRVVLEVADTDRIVEIKRGTYSLHGPWRRATARDLAVLEAEELAENKRNFSEKVFRRGTRFKATKANFNTGAEGEIIFQEPRGGRVWVLRDGSGSGSPNFYYADEIEQWPRVDYKLWLKAAGSPQGL